MAKPAKIDIQLRRGERVNPSHPKGSAHYTGKGVIYVVDFTAQMWAIFSPYLLPGWYPGTGVTVAVNGIEYSCKVRGATDLESSATTGSVPNVPCQAARYTGERR